MPERPLSVFLIVKNEEKNIARCLGSVAWADEIVVVDSGSTDQTVEICRRFTDNVHERPFKNYSDQKNYALSLVSGEWALSLDADEEVGELLKGEILNTVQCAASTTAAYQIPRRSFIFGREFRFTGTQDDRPVRLMRKGRAVFEQPIHEWVKVNGEIGILKNFLTHRTYKDLSDYCERLNRYTSMEADYLVEKSYRIGHGDRQLKPLGMFLKLYLWKQGFRDGCEGFVFSVLSAFYVFLKYAKAAEKGKPRG